MKRLPLAIGRQPLAALRRPRCVLAFDFDGVLAPIVSLPFEAKVFPRTRLLLSRLTRSAPCIVISGRALPDLRQLVAGLPFVELVGNHGAERDGKRVDGADDLLRSTRRWRKHFLPLLGSGIELEDKRFSLSLHYRKAPRPTVARRRILEACAKLEDARIVPGKLLINVVGALAPNKGGALTAICRERRAPAALFVGDDRTDEDVFGLPWKGLVSVRVGRSVSSRARFYLDRQLAVNDLLEALLRLRPERHTQT